MRLFPSDAIFTYNDDNNRFPDAKTMRAFYADTLCLSISHSLSLSFSLSHTHIHGRTHIHIHPPTHPHKHSHSHSPPPHTQTLTFTHSYAHPRAFPNTFSLYPFLLSLIDYPPFILISLFPFSFILQSFLLSFFLPLPHSLSC